MIKTEKKRLAWLILIDIVGAVIAAIGVIDFAGDGNTGSLLMIVVGLCFMLPLILYIPKLLPRKSTEKNNSTGEN